MNPANLNNNNFVCGINYTSAEMNINNYSDNINHNTITNPSKFMFNAGDYDFDEEDEIYLSNRIEEFKNKNQSHNENNFGSNVDKPSNSFPRTFVKSKKITTQNEMKNNEATQPISNLRLISTNPNDDNDPLNNPELNKALSATLFKAIFGDSNNNSNLGNNSINSTNINNDFSYYINKLNNRNNSENSNNSKGKAGPA